MYDFHAIDIKSGAFPRSINIAIIVFFLHLLIRIPLSAAEPLPARVGNVLASSSDPESLIDSALNIVLDECVSSLEGFSEGEEIIKKQILPYVNKHRKQVSLFKQSEVYTQYAMLCGQQGASRFDDTQALNDKALKLAQDDGDFYMMGFILTRKAIFEDRYGSTEKAFSYYNDAISNYKKAPENSNTLVAGSYLNKANIYRRINDYDGLRQTISDFERFISETTPLARDYMLYELYRMKGVYFSHISDNNPSNSSYVDSLRHFTGEAIHLYETSEDPVLSSITNPVWLYYNHASHLVKYEAHPDADSVEYYLNKMTGSSRFTTAELDFEVWASQQQVRAEMLVKLGDLTKARGILLDLQKRMESQSSETKDLIHNKIDLYTTLREIAEKTDDYRNALVYADSLNNIRREMTDNDHRNAIKDIEIKYHTRETELSLAKSESRRAQTLLWLLAAIIALLVIGVIFLIYAGRQKRRFLRQEKEYAELKADTVKQLMREYFIGLENERQRMARELHDGVCNDLLAIRMTLSGDSTQQHTANLIDECREAVRRISHELLPPEFTYANLDEVVHFMVKKLANNHNDRLHVAYDSFLSPGESWEEVPDAVALNIYRIIQEALGNVVKHSDATEARVSLRMENHTIKASVTDNGSPTAVSPHSGIGMESMRRRARSINGELTSRHLPEGGIEIILTVVR